MKDLEAPLVIVENKQQEEDLDPAIAASYKMSDDTPMASRARRKWNFSAPAGVW